MDINYLLEREQIARVSADRAVCDSVRVVHSDVADSYRRLIEQHRSRVAAAFGARRPLRPLFG